MSPRSNVGATIGERIVGWRVSESVISKGSSCKRYVDISRGGSGSNCPRIGIVLPLSNEAFADRFDVFHLCQPTSYRLGSPIPSRLLSCLSSWMSVGARLQFHRDTVQSLAWLWPIGP